MKIIGILIAAIVLFLVVVAVRAMQTGKKAPAAGAPAPDFTVNSQEGKPVSLHDFRGKWVVLYFYPKDFTSGCTKEAHNFQRDIAQFEQKNAVILGVSVQDERTHQKFCEKEGLSFRLLADTKYAVSTAYDSLDESRRRQTFRAPHLSDRPRRRRPQGLSQRRCGKTQRRTAGGFGDVSIGANGKVIRARTSVLSKDSFRFKSRFQENLWLVVSVCVVRRRRIGRFVRIHGREAGFLQFGVERRNILLRGFSSSAQFSFSRRLSSSL